MTYKENNITFIEIDLFNELSQLVEQSQKQVIIQNNATLTLLFW
ncbi:hypothetical protein Flavo103_41560 [Flavobacterium collinsii]|nr:hypothetical protein Flavo103_41560 [Flavobacterium collinsii]